MKSKPKAVILAISIAIVLALFIGITIETFYPTPDYEDFCDEKAYQIRENQTRENCENRGGKWNPTLAPEGEGYCDYDYFCREELENERENHGKTVFIISEIIGFIALLVGWLALKKEAVSTGIMGGGAMMVIYGIMRYWSYAQDYLRLIILGIILAILIIIGYKKLN